MMLLNTYNDWLHQLMQGQTLDIVYLIELRKKLDKYFLYTLIERNAFKEIIWTQSLGRAHVFTSEQHVEEFKADLISPRKVAIVRMKPQDVLTGQ